MKPDTPNHSASVPAVAGACPELAEGPSRPRTPLGKPHRHFLRHRPPAPRPGTWGSATTVLLWAAIAYALPPVPARPGSRSRSPYSSS